MDGENGFYEEVFGALRIPYQPVKWEDRPAWWHRSVTSGSLTVDAFKEAAVLQLVNAYRVRGHLMADLDPLNSDEPSYHAELDPLTYGLNIWDLEREFSNGTFGGAVKFFARGHLTRHPGAATCHLLRQVGMRVHEHPASGAEALAAGADGAGDQQLANRKNGADSGIWRICWPGKSLNIFCTRGMWGRSVFRWKERRRRFRSWKRF